MGKKVFKSFVGEQTKSLFGVKPWAGFCRIETAVPSAYPAFWSAQSKVGIFYSKLKIKRNWKSNYSTTVYKVETLSIIQ